MNRRHIINRYLPIVLLMVFCSRVFASTNDVIDVAMRQGNVNNILRVLDSVSGASRASAPLRAKSFKLRGDHQYILGNYAQAAELYSQAVRHNNASIYRYRHALALANSGRRTQAAEILHAIAVVSADTMGGRAALVLQHLPPVNQQATSSNQQRTETRDAVVPSAVQPAQTSAFTIQVGAFGSRENADNLYRNLTGTYNDVTIQSTNGSGGSVLHKVRIGTFASRQEAQTFADSLIANAGMTARVVEK